MIREEDLLFNDDVLGFEEGLLMRTYTADFETTTDPEDCRVWAYAVCEVGNPEFVSYGNSIEGFLSWCEAAANCQLYFHNLAFDGAFIFDYLLKSGWRYVARKERRGPKTFTALIGEQNQVYSIELFFDPVRKVRIWDSLKVIPLSIKAMAKAYGLPIGKGELDYSAYREAGHELTDEEREYIKGDVQIAAMALQVMLSEGMSRMTAGSNALGYFKKGRGGDRKFRNWYPLLDSDADAFLRKAYRGGFTYVNPAFQGRDVGEGIVLDVNSLYPSVMYCEKLPFGEPMWFDGEPRKPMPWYVWVALGNFDFKLKEGCIPSLQLKNNPQFAPTEYITEGSRQWITLTNVDFELMCEQYDVTVNEWFGGYAFDTSEYEFREYIDHWMGVKEQATVEGNSGMRQIAKLQLNSLYGKFATRTTCEGKHPELDERGVVRYVRDEPEERPPVYLPVGIFVTSYARAKTIRSAQACYGRFCYADTDSLHLVGTEVPEGLDVDPVKMGAWKHESTFDHAKFLHAKCYVEHEAGTPEEDLTVHVAGMPATCHDSVTLENFEIGAEYDGKLYPRRVPGGIVLEEAPMRIRER